MPHISLRGLTKTYRSSLRGTGFSGALKGLFARTYREITALQDVSFSVETGEILGYIGPNGAGKSTTIKILSGIMRPDRGECTVAGRVPWENRIEHVRRIGAVFGQRTQLWWDLPVEESFSLLRTMYRVPAPQFRRSLGELTDLLVLAPLLRMPVRQLSLGQRMRCDLAASLLHNPDTLFLDEPTIGLDATAKVAVRRFIRGLRDRRGTAVILTTHDMDDIEELSDRVILLNEGEIVYRGDLNGLRSRYGFRRRLTIETAGAAPIAPVPSTEAHIEGGRVTYWYDPKETDVARIIAAVSSSRRIVDLTAEAEPIERVVAQIYEESRG